MKIADIMTINPLTVEPTDTIRQADEIINENGFRQLPVLVGRELVGIVTDRDIRSFLGGRLLGAPEEREHVLNTKILSLMTRKPISLSPDDELRDVLELLIEEKVGSVPIVDQDRALVGIVTYVDLLRCFLDRLEDE